MCQKRIMSIQMFRRPTKSARFFTILPIPRHATPSRDQATLLVFVHLRRLVLGKGDKILSGNHHVLDRRE